MSDEMKNRKTGWRLLAWLVLMGIGGWPVLPAPAALTVASTIGGCLEGLPAVRLPADTATPKAASNGIACRVEADRGVLLADAPQRVVLKVTLAAPPAPKQNRSPVNLALVLDRSGSMGGQKLEKAKEAAIEVLRRLEAQDIFSLVIYDTQVQTLAPAQPAVNFDKIEAQIRQIRAGDNTALFAGVSQGAAELRKNPDGKYVRRLILLSDGQANVGPQTPEELGRLGAALSKEGMAVTTVGLGTGYNEDLMAKLAQNSDGNTYFVENSQELPRIFKAELGDVLSVAAKKVDLAVECAEGVRPIAVIGREGRIKGQTMELSLNQLYGGQEKYVLLEVEVSAGKHGLNRELAIAKATYDNACTSTRDTARGSVRCRFSNDRAEEKASVNAGVLSAYHVNLYSVAEAEAIELADAGKIADAALKLDEAGQRLLKAGRELSDKELEKKGDYLIAQAVEIRKDGLSARNRKLLRSDAFQNINQQSYR